MDSECLRRPKSTHPGQRQDGSVHHQNCHIHRPRSELGSCAQQGLALLACHDGQAGPEKNVRPNAPCRRTHHGTYKQHTCERTHPPLVLHHPSGASSHALASSIWPSGTHISTGRVAKHCSVSAICAHLAPSSSLHWL